MKKTIYLVCITIVTIICVVIGYLMHNSYKGWFGGKLFGSLNKTHAELEEFEAISADSNIMDITIEAGTAYAISCRYSDGYEPDYNVKEGTLTVTQKQKYRWSEGNITCEVIVTVPQNKIMKNLTIISDVGDIDIKNIECELFDYRGDVGDLMIEHCIFDLVKIETDVGDIDCKRSQFDNMTIQSDTGDVEVDSAVDLSDYSIELTSDIEDIEVNGREEGGNYNVSGTSGKNLKITVDTGDIELHY